MRPPVSPSVGREAAKIGGRARSLERRVAGGNGGELNIKVFQDTALVAVLDGAFVFAIPSDLNGLHLVDAQAYVTNVSSSGLPTVQIRNITQAVDMLSTKITIKVSEYASFGDDSTATPSVVDTGNDEVETGDLIAIDVDVAGTGAKGLGVILRFDSVPGGTGAIGPQGEQGPNGNATDMGYLCYEEQQAANVNGGTSSSGSWGTRVLNTEVYDTGSDGSLSSNQITLDAGTYIVTAWSQFTHPNRCQIRLYNVTDATELVLGMTGFANPPDDASLVAVLAGKFTVGGSKALELQYRVESGRVTYGLGYGVSWGTNVFSRVMLTRIA